MGKKVWAFSHTKNWYEVDDFFSEKEDIESYLESLGYAPGSGFYEASGIAGGLAIETYRQRGNRDYPEFIVVLNNAVDADYFVAYDLPSVIELIGKLAPMVYVREDLLDKSIKHDEEQEKKRLEDRLVIGG